MLTSEWLMRLHLGMLSRAPLPLTGMGVGCDCGICAVRWDCGICALQLELAALGGGGGTGGSARVAARAIAGCAVGVKSALAELGAGATWLTTTACVLVPSLGMYFHPPLAGRASMPGLTRSACSLLIWRCIMAGTISSTASEE